MMLLQELSRDDKEALVRVQIEKAYRHLLQFCFFCDRRYKYAEHLDYIAQKLEKVERGEITKLMIFAPPRHGKSELTSYNFPAWYLIRNPDKRVIHSSYSATLSNMFSKRVRDLVESKKVQVAYDIRVNPESRAGDQWDLMGRRGGMMSTGVGGSITGFGANLFIIDDPIKNQQEAESAVYQETMYEWYKNVVRTRLEPGASLILMMTRWHQHDLAGRILEDDPDGWVVINLAAVAEEGDALGRAVGEPLCDWRYGLEDLAKIEHDVGSRVWNALYQGRPVDPKSALIKRDWIRYYDAVPPGCVKFGGVDTATSKNDVADDMAVVELFQDKEGFLYVDDVFLEKVSVTQFAKLLSNKHKISPFTSALLESNNAGEAIKQRIDEVAREEHTYVPVWTQATDKDKVVRVIEFQPLVESGVIKFRRGNQKVQQLIDRLCSFSGKASDRDDDIDALGFAIKAAKFGSREFIRIL